MRENNKMSEGQHGGHHKRRQAIRRKIRKRHGHFYHRITHWTVDTHGTTSPVRWRHELWVLAAATALIVLLSAVAMPSWASAMKRDSKPAAHQQVALRLPPPPANTDTAPARPRWHKVSVEAGQTLSDIFAAQGFDHQRLQQTLDASDEDDMLQHLHPDDALYFRTDDADDLAALRFDDDATHRVTLTFNNGDASRSVTKRKLEHRRRVAHGRIQSSLFGAGQKAGLSNAAMIELADVFKYDIDFIKDIRQGDSFTVVYDAVYRDGRYMHTGKILAAEFHNDGKRYTAYRFTKPNGDTGYYTAQGRPLEKSLLRTPVKFTRISSKFSRARKHPILGYTRAHKGVDYASPTGTPIHAAGDGTITVRGKVSGYGNYIRIKHSAKYSTVYGHMSRFASGFHRGSHVEQGDVIGYVGQTGLATGPHLHYEVRVHGHAMNPLNVTLPKPEPLKPKLLAQFKQHRRPLQARIQRIDENVRLAHADTPDSETSSAG